MNNFQTRLLSGIVYIAILCLGILVNELSAHILFLSLSFLALREYRTISKKSLDTPRYYISFILGIHIYIYFNLDFFNAYFPSIGFSDKSFVTLNIGLLFYLEMILLLINYKTQASKHILTSIFSYVYSVLPFALAVPFSKVYNIGDYNGYSVLYVFIFIWASDTFAYLVGRKFGKNKLFEAVSPKKTWEGFIGGGILTVLLGVVISLLTDENMLAMSILALLAFIFGSIGDLIQSTFKRTVDIKDSSNLIPGHGGILDRLDSFIFAMPIIYLIFSSI